MLWFVSLLLTISMLLSTIKSALDGIQAEPCTHIQSPVDHFTIQGLYMCHVSNSVTSITSLLVCKCVAYLPIQKSTPVLLVYRKTCLFSHVCLDILCLCQAVPSGYHSSHFSHLTIMVQIKDLCFTYLLVQCLLLGSLIDSGAVFG